MKVCTLQWSEAFDRTGCRHGRAVSTDCSTSTRQQGQLSGGKQERAGEEGKLLAHGRLRLSGWSDLPSGRSIPWMEPLPRRSKVHTAPKSKRKRANRRDGEAYLEMEMATVGRGGAAGAAASGDGCPEIVRVVSGQRGRCAVGPF